VFKHWLCCSMEGVVRMCCRSDLYRPFFLVLASLERMSALMLLLRGTCLIWKVSKYSINDITMW